MGKMLVAESDSSDDCVLVEVKMPPDDLVQKAVSLDLPPTFFNYLDEPPCPGCIGCRSLSELRDAKTSAPRATGMSSSGYCLLSHCQRFDLLHSCVLLTVNRRFCSKSFNL